MQHRIGRAIFALLLGGLVVAAGLGGLWANRLAAPPVAAAPGRQAATASPTPGGSATTPNPEVVPGQVVVRLRPPAGNQPAGPTGAQSALSSAGIPSAVQAVLLAPDTYVLGVPAGQEAAAAGVLARIANVETADPNYVRHIHAAAVVPNDPLYPTQWGWPRINAPAAWASTQAPNVVVAVLDTGLDLNHPEFVGRITRGTNFINSGGSPQDDNGHGTHVSGIIAASGNNGIGGTGLAWRAGIMPVKVADSGGNLTSAAWINGLAYAVQNGAQVVNMSFGGTSYSGTEQAAINDAWNAGVVIFASAGNSGDTGNPVEYPASYNNVVSVAAIGSDNLRAYYSESNRFVAVAAPGGNARFSNDPPDHFVLSTWPLNIPSNFQTGYQQEIGTSQAAAFASGLAALMLSTGAGWTNASIVQRMEASATDLGPAGRDDQYGYGLINAAAAIAGAPGVPATATPRPPPTATPRPPAPTATARPRPATPTIGPGCLYSDVCPADSFFSFVQDLVRRGAMAGYGDNTFRPQGTVTRGQIAKILVLAAGFDLALPDTPHFADVPPTDPFYPYIETAVSQGLIGGYRDASFRPYTAITRGQLAKMLVLTRNWPFSSPDTSSFRDVPLGSAFYYYVETVAGLQVMPGYADGTFRPDASMTRADVSKIVDVAFATFRPGPGLGQGGGMAVGGQLPYNTGAVR